MNNDTLVSALHDVLGERILGLSTALGQVTVEISADCHHVVCERLRDDPRLGFEVMIDLCGIDYSTYGNTEWDAPRFAVVMQLLSIQHNIRMRLRSFCMDDESPVIESVTDLWPCANWFEREAFDFVVVQNFVFVQTVGNHVIQLAGNIDARAVGQVAAVGKAHA